MKNLNKILIAGSFILTASLGYCTSDYLDGRRECAYSRNTSMADAMGNHNLELGQNTNMKQVTESYMVTGNCDFDFNELNEVREE